MKHWCISTAEYFSTNFFLLAMKTAVTDECYAEEYVKKVLVHNFSEALYAIAKFLLSTQRDESSGISSGAAMATTLDQSSIRNKIRKCN